jgi:uncharacterized protein YbcC (UPF0753/DUF2309 family)
MNAVREDFVASEVDPDIGLQTDQDRDPDGHQDSEIHAAIDCACARIAPTWPLDRFIAVNPYWGQLERTMPAAAAQLAVLSGSPILMPRSGFRAEWDAGRVRPAHLQSAIEAAGASCTVDELVASLQAPAGLPGRLPLATDLVDAHRDLGHAMAWRDYVTHHVSQCCAAYFDQGQAAWGPDHEGGLYPSWLRQSAHDFGPAMLMGDGGFTRRLAALPAQPQALIATALRTLGLPEAAYEPYCTALLMSINGWASWCAYQRWQARLMQRDDAQIVHLLAVRMAWEWLLHDGHPEAGVADGLRTTWRDCDSAFAQARAAQQHDWLWQAALERSYQQPLCSALTAPPPAQPEARRPAVQAVFCIDVRSEVYRRALEASSPDVQTLGFAGFFGLPIAYQPLGSALQRPQLPGLLAPAFCVTDECAESTEHTDAAGPALGAVLAQRRRKLLQAGQQWQAFRSGAGSGFSFVESCGLLYAAKLFKRRLGSTTPERRADQAGLSAARRDALCPRLPAHGGPDLAARCTLAARVLNAMGLKAGLARLVLLAGHGGQSANNPHAAGLDCGACGGQTGEVNARVLAQLLNDPAVRRGLPAYGVDVSDDTVFVAGLHNTTTDDLVLHDTDRLPDSHAADLARLQDGLAAAGRRARAERAATLGLGALSAQPDALHAAVQARACDWAQTRPEWGLAGCASFIVAPRNRTRHLNLGGRSFLHEYRWQDDPGFKVLEGVMTAPMVVTHWINLQYHASVVDPRRYGSGNKLLHNVVGGHIGVFEGNGGDLRIGLPLQSVHDGTDWRHTPLRLSVFIQAPQSPIDRIMAEHDTVRQLVDNDWLHLFRLDDTAGCWRYTAGSGWQPVGA